jgi:peptide deformylase
VEVDPQRIGTPEFQGYLDILIETMHVEDGVGLASPQVGRNERIIIVNHRGKGLVYINPVITKRSENQATDEEGCLSVPGVWGMVERAKKISIQALDRHGRIVELDCKGLDAAIFQHEIDHLDGILFIDRVTRFTKGADRLPSNTTS